MNLTAMWIGVALGFAVWFFLLLRLRARPWLEAGTAFGPNAVLWSLPPQAVGLGIFMAVVTSLFALLASAYHMRMKLPDWSHVPLPGLLWFNTALLVLASGALSSACRSLAGGARSALRRDLLGGSLLATAFLAGQWLVWSQLYANGFFLNCSAGAAFFYLFTALHGVHLLGGLCVLAKTQHDVYRGDLAAPAPVAAALAWKVRLCAVYWHFLLLIWLALFALLWFT